VKAKPVLHAPSAVNAVSAQSVLLESVRLAKADVKVAAITATKAVAKIATMHSLS
jgi:hypothetical protein